MSPSFFSVNKKHIRAFTLIEALVSMSIITLVMMGPLTVAINSSSYARQTRDVMTATYLAQEALELLHHQQDAMYLACLADHSTSVCPGVQGETVGETAWRMFEAKLSQNVYGASCYIGDNPHGCAFDFIDMATDAATNPSKYDAQGEECSKLSLLTLTQGDGTPTRYLYVCAGVVSHLQGIVTATSFSRAVSIESISVFPEGGVIYNDDLRVTVTMTFSRANGYTRTLSVVDFFHMH